MEIVPGTSGAGVHGNRSEISLMEFPLPTNLCKRARRFATFQDCIVSLFSKQYYIRSYIN